MGHNADKLEGNWIMVVKDYAKEISIYVLSKNMTQDIDLNTKPMADELSETQGLTRNLVTLSSTHGQQKIKL
ncbi:hypothetical protein MHB43_17420 [Paenibacillus sp. FSL H8-0317]|uniref:hypothetical protein n=1 Tax=Paenibacillus sp. FSL H8-0317 TaxID=2921385 RepID=UPI0032568333